jgi:predicted  nucleic acid-binding Zn-ribbon protein
VEDLKNKMKIVSRRIAHLRTRIDSGPNQSSSSYDKAEITALDSLLRVAAVYNDARGPHGSHVENTLYMVRDVIDDTLAENKGTLDAHTQERLQSAWTKLSETIQVIRKVADDDAKKDP